MLMLAAPTTLKIGDRTLGTISFFLWQALVISVEDATLWMTARGRFNFGKGESCRYVGLLWVMTSFWILVPWVANDLLRMGLLTPPMLPNSPMEHIAALVTGSY